MVKRRRRVSVSVYIRVVGVPDVLTSGWGGSRSWAFYPRRNLDGRHGGLRQRGGVLGMGNEVMEWKCGSIWSEIGSCEHSWTIWYEGRTDGGGGGEERGRAGFCR